MQPPKIDNSTQEERQAYVLDAWKCLHNCEICGKCHILRCRDPETLYADYIQGKRSYMDVTLEIRNRTIGQEYRIARIDMEAPFPEDITRRYSVFNQFLERRTDDVLSKYPIVGGFVYFSQYVKTPSYDEDYVKIDNI